MDADTNVEDDVYVTDLENATTELVSVNNDGIVGNADSGLPSISGDGRYVAFSSYADNLVSGDTNEKEDVFVHDRETKKTLRVSLGANGTEGDSHSTVPKISLDGRFIAFFSSATNLVDGDNNSQGDIFVFINPFLLAP